jgi:hypothetical protein
MFWQLCEPLEESDGNDLEVGRAYEIKNLIL